MTDADVGELAGALRVGVGLLMRRLKQVQGEDSVSMPGMSALARLDRGGPATAAELARQEQISPQSMGVTLAGLEGRGLLARGADPDDGRRVVLSLTADGRRVLGDRRSARTERLAAALADGFTAAELGQLTAVLPLLERLAQKL